MNLVGLAAWGSELAATAPTLVRAALPGGGLDRRARLRLGADVARALGAPVSAWVQDGLALLVGEVPLDDLDAALGALADEVAVTRRPPDVAPLAAAVPERSLTAARGVVAVAALVAEAERCTRRTWERAGGRRPVRDHLGGAAVDAGVAVSVLAPGAAAVLAGGLARGLARLAPDLPDVEGPADPEGAGLLATVLVQAVPAYLSGVGPRVVVGVLPVPVAVGVRAGLGSATVRVGAGRIEVRDGIDADVVAVVEGDAEPLLSLAAGAVTREVALRLPH